MAMIAPIRSPVGFGTRSDEERLVEVGVRLGERGQQQPAAEVDDLVVGLGVEIGADGVDGRRDAEVDDRAVGKRGPLEEH